LCQINVFVILSAAKNLGEREKREAKLLFSVMNMREIEAGY